MPQHILVAYASISGSTAEVAEAIGLELTRQGATVTVLPARDVTDLAGYDAVVLGSSIRVGRWLPDAVRLISEQRAALRELPVALFTTCLTMARDSAENRRKVLAYLEPVRQLAPEVSVIALGLFAGSIDPHHRIKIMADQGPEVDFRDWDAIELWAREVGTALQGREREGVDSAEPAPVILAGAMLTLADMTGVDMSAADLREVQLTKARLVDTNFAGANLSRADLSETNLSGANLAGAGLYWAALRGSTLHAASLVQANLIGADLTAADLSLADAAEAIFNGAIMKNAFLRGTNLTGADLSWSDLGGADLSGARLGAANLSYADLTWANLTGAELDGAYYNEQTRWPEGFDPQAHGCVFLRQPF